MVMPLLPKADTMRYLPLGEADRSDMMARIGISSVDELFEGVPEAARLTRPLDLPPGQGEMAVERAIAQLAGKNRPMGAGPSFIGAGAYRHHVPASVDHLIQRSEFLTAYTPYQPEISQGTLQVLFEFQTQVALITGMDVANASMYDGATACAEAVMMAARATRRKQVVMSGNLHPHYRDSVLTASQFLDLEIGVADPLPEIDKQTACVVVQNPDVFGRLRDLSGLADQCHEVGALLVVAVPEVVSLGAVKSPGEMGADIVVCEGQGIGNGLNFGGPYLGLFATRDKYVRQMPGRLCGETVDADDRRGYVLTLSAREQHIRREKATSNICTNSGLCALAFSIHLSLLGEDGFKRLAMLNHQAAAKLADKLAALSGVELLEDSFFNEFTLKLPRNATDVVDELVAKDVLAGVPASRLFPDREDLANHLIVAATETNTDEEMDAFATALGEVLS
jgi:glycine dehydrogenase subunit 1